MAPGIRLFSACGDTNTQLAIRFCINFGMCVWSTCQSVNSHTNMYCGFVIYANTKTTTHSCVCWFDIFLYSLCNDTFTRRLNEWMNACMYLSNSRFQFSLSFIAQCEHKHVMYSDLFWGIVVGIFSLLSSRSIIILPLLFLCECVCVCMRVYCMGMCTNAAMVESRLLLPSGSLLYLVHCFSCFHVIIISVDKYMRTLRPSQSILTPKWTHHATIYHNELGCVFFSLQWKWIEFSILAKSSYLKLKSYSKNQTEPQQIEQNGDRAKGMGNR